MAIKGVDSSFTIARGKERLETRNFWTEFKVTRDSKRGDEYIDVVMGRRNRSKSHAHVGINLDQSIRFINPRSVLIAVRREIDSKHRGRLKDETIRFSEPGGEGAQFTLKVLIDGPTKTITPSFEEAVLKEKSSRDVS